MGLFLTGPLNVAEPDWQRWPLFYFFLLVIIYLFGAQ